jgi:mannose-6-phosphate isomerase-like protein (cupin superfamily)
MRATIVIGLLLGSAVTFAQAPAPAPKPVPAAPTTPAPKPAPAAQPPAARRPATPPARAGLAFTVTGPQGATLPGVRVEIVGASDRIGETNISGQATFPGLQAGTYRVRFSGDQVIGFEKEVTLRAGQIGSFDIMLNAAPPPPEAPPPPPAPEPEDPPAAVVGPAGEPRSLSLVDLIERDLIPNNQPRRDTLVSCSGSTRSTLVQLNQDQPQRLYDTAEVTYYVVAGEGSVKMDGRDIAVVAGSFVSIPRGTSHAISRRGRRPLIMLATLSGTPCEQAR